MGSPDDLKLKSSMTLFNAIDETKDNVFKKVVEKFFKGYLGNKTINLLKKWYWFKMYVLLLQANQTYF